MSDFDLTDYIKRRVNELAIEILNCKEYTIIVLRQGEMWALKRLAQEANITVNIEVDIAHLFVAQPIVMIDTRSVK